MISIENIYTHGSYENQYFRIYLNYDSLMKIQIISLHDDDEEIKSIYGII